MKLFFARLLTLAIFFQAPTTQANLSSENIIDLQTDGLIYTPSEVLESDDMNYPSSAYRDMVEGYLDVIYDVDTQGKPINLRYHRVSGTDIFETIIERNFDNWLFTPAQADGTPIVQKNLERTFLFTITKKANKFPEPLMRKKFAITYVKMRDFLKAQDYEALGSLITTMKQSNIIRFSENRQLAIIIYAYLEKTGGSIQDQILWLERALKGSPRSDNIIKRHNKIKSNLFKKYFANHQYRSAYQIFNELRDSEFGDNLLPSLLPMMAELSATLNSGDTITTTIKVDATALFSQRLSRRVFSVTADQAISFTELRCATFNVSFDYAQNTAYQLPFDWHNCRLVIGAPAGSLVTISEAAIYGDLE